jgi:hypothetical protein
VVQADEAPKTAEQKAAEAKKQKEKQDREQHDRFLLTTYTSTRDIDRLRDERVGQIDAQVQAAQAYVVTVETRLKTLTERAQQFKPYSDKPTARRIPDDLALQLVLVANEVKAQRTAIDKQRQQSRAVSARFDADAARYRELTVSK